MQVKQELTEITGKPYITYEQMNILINYQKLWSQLALWMRTFISHTLEKSKDLSYVTTRLFENVPLNFYHSFTVFYGVDTARQFLTILTRFLSNVWKIANAYLNNDSAAINSSTVAWYQSADELASFLESVNVYWDEAIWRRLLYQYIQLYIQQIIARVSGDFKHAHEINDTVEELTYIIGSYMAKGIIANTLVTSPTPTPSPHPMQMMPTPLNKNQ